MKSTVYIDIYLYMEGENLKYNALYECVYIRQNLIFSIKNYQSK
jgi:hypothetical protein